LQRVLPALEVGEDRDVVGGQRVLAGPERVAELAQVDELRDLRLAHDELRAVLDFLVLVGEAVRQRVARVVRPLDDVDELLLEEIDDGHARILALSKVKVKLTTSWRRRASSLPRPRC
jgi:hypothetical protein